MNINWKKALGYGVLVYLVIYVVATAFIAYKINPQQDVIAWTILVVVSIITGYFFSIRLGMQNYQEALEYGIVWAVIMIIFDLILTVPFTGFGFMTNWHFFTTLVLTILIPPGSLFVHGLLIKGPKEE
jgi:hypothetical protein